MRKRPHDLDLVPHKATAVPAAKQSPVTPSSTTLAVTEKISIEEEQNSIGLIK